MMLLRGLPLSSILLLTVHLALTGCVNDATTLAQEPSLLDQDDVSPTCPGLKTVTIASGPSLSLVWAEARDNFSQASKINYKIYIKKNNENYDLISPGKIIEGGTSTLVTNGISVGNTYTTFVTCSDEKGNTAPTGPANEMSILVADSQPPAAINNLVADHETFNSILLTWSPSDDGLGGTTAANMRYKIYASTTSPVSTAGSPLTTVLNGATSYIHTGLSPATTWYYKVVALDALDNASAASNEATGTTLTDTTSPTFTGNVAGLEIGRAHV